MAKRRKKRAPLRTSMTRFETDTLIPLWLVASILAAAGSEVWTIGSGVFEIYDIYVGWAIGLTIASAQAMASMLAARAISHNAAARTVTKVAAWASWIKLIAGALNRRLPQRRVIDVTRSDPRLDARVPVAISAGAGLASALASWALYNQLEPQQGILNVILAIVAPAGSLAAALLNGVFVYGEQAVAARPASSATRKKPAATRTRKRAAKPPEPEPPPPPARNPATDPTLAAHLATLAAASNNGQLGGQPFTRRKAQTILGKAESWTKKIIRYGLEAEELEKVQGPGYRYQFKDKNL